MERVIGLIEVFLAEILPLLDQEDSRAFLSTCRGWRRFFREWLDRYHPHPRYTLPLQMVWSGKRGRLRSLLSNSTLVDTPKKFHLPLDPSLPLIVDLPSYDDPHVRVWITICILTRMRVIIIAQRWQWVAHIFHLSDVLYGREVGSSYGRLLFRYREKDLLGTRLKPSEMGYAWYTSSP